MTRRVAMLVSAVLLTAGCGGPGPQSPPAPLQTTTTAPTTTVPTTTTPPPYTPPAGPLTAADGTNLKACAKGTCEVIVKSGDQIRFNLAATGLASLTVSSVSATDFSLYFAAGSGFMSTMGSGIGTGEFGTFSGPARGGGTNKIVFTAGDGKDGAMVLRLAFSKV